MVRLLFVLALLLGALSAAPAQAQSCEAATGAFNAARGGDIPTLLERLAGLDAAGCGEQVRYCAGQAVALRYLEHGYGIANAGRPLGEVKAMLLDGKTHGAPWQLLAGLADLSLMEARGTTEGPLFAEAATYFQDALNTINEAGICGEAGLPSEAEIAAIHRRMTEALLLAPELEVVRTREGGCGGIFLQSIRGFSPTFRPLPISFEFNEAVFTPSGEKAASVLLGCLKETSPAEVILSGHTDPKGSDEYNMSLSERRLAAVANYLKAGGYAGRLVLLPKGEREPFEADDPTAYTEAEIDQLNRRVVLRSTAE